MTQNTIDLATTALNLTNTSDTASLGNTGMCGGKLPFGKSLQEAMQTADITSAAEGGGTEQLLPPVGQELPLQSAYTVGLEGITEVRALADAISAITSSATTDAGSPLDQFDKAFVASRSNPAAATALSGTFGFDPSNSEGVNFDLRQEIGAHAGNSYDNINRHIGSFNGTLSSVLHESRMTISDTVLIAETTSSKDNASRSLSLDTGIGLSSITQSESKLVNRGNSIQVSQPPFMTKSAEVVSSNELATHLRVLKSSGGGEARLQLHPAELGRMTISLITEGDETRVSFVVDNPQAKQAVEVSLPRLRDLMDEAGLSLTDADVSDRHAKENEDQAVVRVEEEAIANPRNDAEDFGEFTSPTSSQLVDTFA